MSDRLKEVFEKHSSALLDGNEDSTMSFDQFEAAVKELMPSDEEIMAESHSRYPDFSHQLAFEYAFEWLESHILGTDKKDI